MEGEGSLGQEEGRASHDDVLSPKSSVCIISVNPYGDLQGQYPRHVHFAGKPSGLVVSPDAHG